MAHREEVEREIERQKEELESMKFAPVDKNDARHMKRIQEEREKK